MSVSHCKLDGFTQMPGAVPVYVPLALILLFMCTLNLLSGLQRVARQGTIPVIPTRSIAAASHGVLLKPYAASMTVSGRLPAFFITHGGGPMPLMNDPSHAPLIKHWQKLRAEIAKELKPHIKAVVVVSAHWESDGGPTVTSWDGPRDLLFDYYGFPPESYKFKYPSPGSPQLAQRIVSLFRGHGIKANTDSSRGFDHAVFVPLLGLMPEADVPVVAVSVISNMDPKEHIEMGKALAPLRDEGVLLIGSGMTFHSLKAIFSGTGDGSKAREFDDYLHSAVTAESPTEREAKLEAWSSAPHARYCHPREEHLVPLMAVAGAAHDAGKGTVIFSEELMGMKTSSFRFDG